jgi:hypothetical protein
MESNQENAFVTDRLGTLEPQWSPDVARARASLDSRLTARSRPWTWPIAATAAVCAAVLAIPGTRAVAQELWDRFVLNRVDIVRIDLSRLPLSTHITTNGFEESVPNIEEAGRKAGFRPYLPASTERPALTVLGRIEMEQTIHLPEWEGAKLRTEIGPMISAKYPDGVEVLQFQPVVFSAPSGFPLDRFTEEAFRSIGVSAWEAHALGQRFAAHPSWLVDIPPDQVVNIEDVNLRNGPALLIEEPETAMVVRGTDERIYLVRSGSRDVSLRIAEALPPG